MRSELQIICDYRYKKTYLEDVYYTSPYKIMHPFMTEDKMEVILMSSSAGFLAGDSFHCDIVLKDNAKLTFYTQSYEKILDTMEECACRELKLKLGKQAVLKYLPQPVIPFGNSNFVANGTIHLKSSSSIVYSDICSCGRIAMGERFALKKYESRLKVYVENELVFADCTYIEPSNMKYSVLGMWGNYTHCGMLYIYCEKDEFDMNSLKSKIQLIPENEEILVGITSCVKGILIRSLGMSGETLHRFHSAIAELM